MLDDLINPLKEVNNLLIKLSEVKIPELIDTRNSKRKDYYSTMLFGVTWDSLKKLSISDRPDILDKENFCKKFSKLHGIDINEILSLYDLAAKEYNNQSEFDVARASNKIWLIKRNYSDLAAILTDDEASALVTITKEILKAKKHDLSVAVLMAGFVIFGLHQNILLRDAEQGYKHPVQSKSKILANLKRKKLDLVNHPNLTRIMKS